MKFLLFAMPRLMPLVLPLSVLLASIMSFGSLSENYEFAAMKSSGISFQRMIRSNTAFILILTVISFFFANNVIPYAEYKFINFRRNIAQVKPAMAIAEGQFSEVGNYTIKVEKKSGEKGNFLKGVTIHRKLPNGEGNTTVIIAEKGKLVSSESSNTLKLVLFNGNYYEDIIPKQYEQRNKIPFAKGTFKHEVINIDLSKLNKDNMNNVDISNTTTMLNVNELKFTLDSLNKNYKKDLKSFTENIYLRTGVTNIYYSNPTDSQAKKLIGTDLLKNINKEKKKEIFKIAISNIENTGFSIDSSVFEMESKAKNINSHWIDLYDKYMIAFSCILMFFIGAPLGSIIRKGGLGLPIVFAVAIFIVFHFINTFGKRVAQENQMPAFLGVWMASIILTPLAILLTYRAINDIGGMISFDRIFDPIKKIISKFDKESSTKLAIIALNKHSIVQATINYPEKEIITYNNKLKINLILYVSTITIAIAALLMKTIVWNSLFGISLLVFLYYIYISQKYIRAIEIKTQRTIEPGMIISLLIAYPFYILLYLHNKKALSELEVLNK